MRKRPSLSIIVNFHNMQREGERTLYTLSTEYQNEVTEDSYEVIAIDNGSDYPLSEKFVKSFGKQFRYYYFNTNSLSPSKALNYGVKKARSKNLMFCIDGARMLSPRIIKYTLDCFKACKNPFVYTIGFHIGNNIQNILVQDNYSSDEEDELLESINWKSNGYKLFNISCLAASAKEGFFSHINESNCFSINKRTFKKIGMYDERFSSPGGGIVNLHIFNQILKCNHVKPILLLGEGTFHQFHGGVATNVKSKDHPWREMVKEYKSITNKEEFKSIQRQPFYYGKLCSESLPFAFSNNNK